MTSKQFEFNWTKIDTNKVFPFIHDILCLPNPISSLQLNIFPSFIGTIALFFLSHNLLYTSSHCCVFLLENYYSYLVGSSNRISLFHSSSSSFSLVLHSLRDVSNKLEKNFSHSLALWCYITPRCCSTI
jgi:hypothetical protein